MDDVRGVGPALGVVPGKLIVCAVASAQWGWRVPWSRLIRLLWNWRWWLAVVVAALAGVLLPGHFFSGLPNGTVSHQVWAVTFKLAAAYVLAVGCWIILLAWAAVLLNRAERPVLTASELPLPQAAADTGGDA